MSIKREILAVREHLGLWMRRDQSILQCTGADAGVWLQSQTTNDLLALPSLGGCENALLDRQGRLLAHFSVHRWEQEYWLLIDKAQVQAVFDRVESHLFLEDAQLEDVGEDTPHVCVEGPRTLLFLASLFEDPETGAARLPTAPGHVAPVQLLGHEVLAFRRSESGEDGYQFVPAPGEADALYAALLNHGRDYQITEVSAPARETLRAEGGLGRFGVEYPPGTLIAETPLERVAVHYEKGCYLGQEVVQRMKTYGSPRYFLMGLLGTREDTVFPAAGTPLHIDGRKVGELRGSFWSPTRGAPLAFARLDRDHRVPGSLLQFEEGFTAEVRHLPFVEGIPRVDAARGRYEEALAHFEADAADTDTTAIELLREAILLDPAFEDAYEVLGVILHRHHRVDEAISCMQRLVRLNPNSTMAHSNLSVFYVAKGMIQEAETEKAKAEQLQFKRQLDAQAAQEQAQQDRERIQREARERITLFEEVLTLDPEDPIATMGMGRAFVQLEQPAEAAPYFETAIRAKKDYSAAYLELGKCHETVGRPEAAAAVYREGILAAGRKGDLMPLREMERRLKALEAPALQGRSPG